jgi:N-acetylneuraminate synthase
LDNTTAITSVALGTCIIEKHFTLDRQGGGPDDSFSLEPSDLKALCQGAHTAWTALGRVDYSRQPSEQANLQFRRSLYFVKALKAGDVVQPSDVRSVRPGFGLAPKHMDEVLGKTLRMDVAQNTPVKWTCFNDA